MNTKLPMVSIITPTLNSQKCIENTLRSIKNQTYNNIEHIVVDAVSKDDTLSLVKKYNISKIICEPDKGIIDAFNKGIKKSTGNIIYFLNSDDYLFDNNVIEKVVQVFLNNPDKLMVYGNVLCVDEKYDIKYTNGMEITLNDLKNGEMIPHQGVFVRKCLFDKCGLFDIKYPIVADYDFIIRCFKEEEKNTLYLNETIAVFGLHGECCDIRNKSKLNKIKRQVIEKHFGVSNYSNGVEYENLYRLWLEKILLQDENVTKVLSKQGIKSVVIWGTLKTGRYIYKDIEKEHISVLGFVDNNISIQGQVIYKTKVYSPLWIKDNLNNIDAIIISIESDLHEKDIKNELKNIVGNKQIKIFTWKDIVNMNF